MKHILLLLILCVLVLCTLAEAQIPNKLSYQGLLTGMSDGSYTLKFDIYNLPTGGTLRHTETFSGVSVTQGTFSVLLGSTVTLPAIFSESLYVEITATEGPAGPTYPMTFSPRSALASSPYSLAPWGPVAGGVSYTGGNVGIGTSSPLYKFGIADGPVEIGLSPEAPAASGYIGTVSNHPLRLMANNQTKMVIQPDGKVGIGTGSPSYMLDVQNASGSGSIRAKSGGSGSGVLYLDRPSSSASFSSDIGFTTADSPDFTMGTSQGTAGNDDFSIYDYGTANNVLTIAKSTGNVGIGTTNPTGKFTLKGNETNLLSLASSTTDDMGYLSVGGGYEIPTPCYAPPPSLCAGHGPNLNIGSPLGVLLGGGVHSAFQPTLLANSSGVIIVKSLYVTSSGSTAFFDRSFSDGTVVEIGSNGITQGTISVSGSTVSYNAFTGSHYAFTNELIEYGSLVTLTGDNKHFHNDPKAEIIYGITTSQKANDPACLGAYLGLQESSKPQSTENPHLVMAVGNGDMWVADNGKDIAIGDYLISSSVRGHAMRDNGEYPVSYVIARAAEPVRWNETGEYSGGAKHKKISVFFESFAKTNVSQEITELRRQVDDLKILVHSLAEERNHSGNGTIGELH